MSVPPDSFSLRRIAVPAFGPSLLFGLGEGAILPIIPLSARELGASVPEAALIVALIGVGSLVSNIPASLITMHRGERAAIVAAALWCALAMALCAWTRHLAVFALGGFMVGMSQAVFNLARQSYLTEAVPVEFRARALSTLGGVLRIGMFIGPFASAAAIHRFGLAGAYGVAIGALLLSGIVAARIPDLKVRGCWHLFSRCAGRRRGCNTDRAVNAARSPPCLRHARHRRDAGQRRARHAAGGDPAVGRPPRARGLGHVADLRHRRRHRHAGVLSRRQGHGPEGPALGGCAVDDHHGRGAAADAVHARCDDAADWRPAPSASATASARA